MSSYFQRIKSPLAFSPQPLPTQADLFLIARNWSQLSPEFKSLYKKAIDIPSGFIAYNSPGGHFEIFYSTSGYDSVSIADTIGYGGGLMTWRDISPGGNGVPDYIDMVAWSFDSAWSMEVDQFQFHVPYASVNTSNPSGRYKVIVENLQFGYYGLTYPEEAFPDSLTGFRSLIRIRNNWEGWDNPGEDPAMVYQSHPERAVGITACHEFFHAIQYATVWSVTPSQSSSIVLDDFPVGWLEGTAVLMEELGFNYVNDYRQYARTFFSRPNLSQLVGAIDGFTEYSNGLIAKFLYQHTSSYPDISFIRDIFKSNQAQTKPFSVLLSMACSTIHTTWPILLSDFLSSSYFSGTRYRSGTFITEADSLPFWKITNDSPDTNGVIIKNVKPYSMELFGRRRTSTDADTLPITFGPTTSPTSSDWVIKVILNRKNGYRDTVLDLGYSLLHDKDTVIYDWANCSALVVLAINASGTGIHPFAVSFGDTTEIVQAPDSTIPAIFPNPVSLKTGTVSFSGATISDVRLYTLTGQCIASVNRKSDAQNSAFANTKSSILTWNLKNLHGASTLPGTYLAVIGYTDPSTHSFSYIRKKILVTP